MPCTCEHCELLCELLCVSCAGCSALSDHLEPLYLENLSAAIAKLQELKEA